MIASGRLTLEPLTRLHAGEMFAALSDPAIYRHIEERPPVSVEALAARYARLETRKSADGRQHWLNWVVRETASGTAAGYVQATVLDDGTALIAYVIAPAMQGRGLGREATAAMIEELRACHRVHTLRAGIDRRNAASIALALALGLQQSGSEGDDLFFERRLESGAAG